MKLIAIQGKLQPYKIHPQTGDENQTWGVEVEIEKFEFRT